MSNSNQENNKPIQQGEKIVVPTLWMVIKQDKDGSWRTCRNTGSSTRTRPMIYDDIRCAHRAVARIKGGVLVRVNNMECSYEEK